MTRELHYTLRDENGNRRPFAFPVSVTDTLGSLPVVAN